MPPDLERPLLSDADIDRVAKRLLELLCARLQSPATPPPAPREPKPRETTPKLVYTLAELSAELRLSKVTIYRLEARGLLRSLPAVRRKVFSRKEVERFLETQLD